MVLLSLAVPKISWLDDIAKAAKTRISRGMVLDLLLICNYFVILLAVL